MPGLRFFQEKDKIMAVFSTRRIEKERISKRRWKGVCVRMNEEKRRRTPCRGEGSNGKGQVGRDG